MHLYIGILVLIIIIIVFLCPQTRAKIIKKACDKCHPAAPSPQSGGTESYRTNNCVGTFDCTGEDFTAGGDIAANTMWGGYQYRTVLPRGYIQ